MYMFVLTVYSLHYPALSSSYAFFRLYCLFASAQTHKRTYIEQNFSAKLLSPNYFVNFQLCNFPAFKLLSNIIFNLFTRQTTMWRTLSGTVRSVLWVWNFNLCVILKTVVYFFGMANRGVPHPSLSPLIVCRVSI